VDAVVAPLDDQRGELREARVLLGRNPGEELPGVLAGQNDEDGPRMAEEDLMSRVCAARPSREDSMRKVCIVGASGKLGHYMVSHAPDRGYEDAGVCREERVGKLERFKDRITVVPGSTDDPEVIRRAVA
jgi:hypothetical protein